jgi:DNA-nicking Smr family endonuclease
MTDDQDLWKKVTESIKPIAKDAREKITSKKPKIDISHKTKIDVVTAQNKSYEAVENPLKRFDPDNPADIDHNNFQRLRKGKIEIEARLDLHGFTKADAYNKLSYCMQLWFHEGKRCVLVITGKGLRSEDHRDAIRYQFSEWINTPPLRNFMLAYCQAQPKDGGAGAYYVLLKSKKR